MKQLPDEITIKLHFTDIQEIDDSLTNAEARQVLELIMNKCAAVDAVNVEAWVKYFKSI